MEEQSGFGVHADWKAAVGLLGGGAVSVAPVGSFAWFAGWVLIVGGLFWLVSAITYENKAWWRTYRKMETIVGAMSFVAIGTLAASHFQDQATSIADVSVTFVPDQLDSSALHGRVVVSSSAPSSIRINETRTSSLGSTTGAGATDVRKNQPASFPFTEYFWRGGNISFEAHYSVDGEPAEKAIFARFFVPPNPQIGAQIPPAACCEKPKSDFASLRARDGLMVTNEPQGCHPVIVNERLRDGRPRRVFIPYPRRQFLFDPVEKVVLMRSILRDKWYEISAPLQSTFDGEHQLRYCWHEPNGFMAINVDDSYVMFDVDTGKVTQGELR